MVDKVIDYNKLPAVIVDMRTAIDNYQDHLTSLCDMGTVKALVDARQFIRICLAIPRDAPFYNDDVDSETFTAIANNLPGTEVEKTIRAFDDQYNMFPSYEIMRDMVTNIASSEISEIVGDNDYVDTYCFVRWVDGRYALFTHD